MIDRVYKFVQTVTNNELNGNVSPQEFRVVVNNSVEELYDENLRELKKINDRDSRYGKTFSINNFQGRVSEKIMHYYEPAEVAKVGGKYSLPANLRYLDSVELNNVQVEPLQNRSQFKTIVQFADTSPDLSTPVYLKVANVIELAPTSVTGPVQIYYLRNPKSANWTYQKIKGVEAFDPDHPDFQDIDIHPSEEYQLTIRILQKFGVNLKEEHLAQYGLSKEGNDFQKENIN